MTPRDRAVKMWNEAAGLSIEEMIDSLERNITEAVAAEREACAKIAEEKEREFLSPEYATPQPVGSHSERFACRIVAKAIRERT